MRGIGLLVSLLVCLLVCVAALAGCGGASTGAACGTLAGAVSATINDCSSPLVTRDPSGATNLTLSAGGTSPVTGAVTAGFALHGAPAVGTFSDRDAALDFAQVKFKTADGHEYDADWAAPPQGNGVGHITITISSVAMTGGQYVLHGSFDAMTLQDSAGAVCTAHIDF
jgi:hypothetical protein